MQKKEGVDLNIAMFFERVCIEEEQSLDPFMHYMYFRKIERGFPHNLCEDIRRGAAPCLQRNGEWTKYFDGNGNFFVTSDITKSVTELPKNINLVVSPQGIALVSDRISRETHEIHLYYKGDLNVLDALEMLYSPVSCPTNKQCLYSVNSPSLGAAIVRDIQDKLGPEGIEKVSSVLDRLISEASAQYE